MRARTKFLVALVGLALVLVSTVQPSGPREVDGLHFEIEARALSKAVPRIGLNLGHWTMWGAEQLSRNVLKNPGFEGNIDRAMVIVRSSGTKHFTDSETWLKRSPGFWADAVAEVLSGSQTGQKFQILDSGVDPEGYPLFEVTGSAATLRPGAAVVVTKIDDSQLPAFWWPDPSDGEYLTLSSGRPRSPGKRSVRLIPSTAKTVAVSSYLDMIGERAGKLLALHGKWRLSFWYRAPSDGARSTVTLRRHGSPPFLRRELPASDHWREVQFEMSPSDTGEPGALELRFSTAGGPMWIDDVELTQHSAKSLAFRDEVVETLRSLQPGYLRDWQGQLGDTTANRLASPLQRRTSRYRPGADQIFYHYSLPEFLTLCSDAGANPWIVLPTTLSHEEAGAVGRYLSEAQEVFAFREVLVEFGNENWNSTFRPAGLENPDLHAAVAQRIFDRILHETAGNVPLRTVVNTQFAVPSQLPLTASRATKADMVAVAPYYLHELEAGLSLVERQRKLLQAAGSGWDAVRPLMRSRDVAVYEVNAHTLGGSASAADRVPIVSGRVSGTALAKALLSAARAGVRIQCVYSLSGYDTYTARDGDLVPLFGITRDLAGPHRIRATGLAVLLLNRILPAHLHLAKASRRTDVEFFALQGEAGWGFAAISANPNPVTLTARFPAGQDLPTQALTIAADLTREDGGQDQVRLLDVPLMVEGETIHMTVPAFGVVVGGRAIKLRSALQ